MKTQYLLVALLFLSFSVLTAQETQDKIGAKTTNVAKQSINNTYAIDKVYSTEATNAVTYDFTVAGAAYTDGSITSNPPMKDLGGGVYGMIAGDVNQDGFVKYNGSAADRVAILLEVGFTTPNNVVTAYSSNDVNMDGLVKYNGSAADRVKILTNVGFTTPNNVLETHVP